MKCKKFEIFFFSFFALSPLLLQKTTSKNFFSLFPQTFIDLCRSKHSLQKFNMGNSGNEVFSLRVQEATHFIRKHLKVEQTYQLEPTLYKTWQNDYEYIIKELYPIRPSPQSIFQLTNIAETPCRVLEKGKEVQLVECR